MIRPTTHRTLTGLLVLAASFAGRPALAAPPDPRPTPEELGKWVADLSHTRPAIQHRAKAKLLEAGPDGVIALLRATDAPDTAGRRPPVPRPTPLAVG